MTSNALTDFNQTVFHLSLGARYLQDGLLVLQEVGFAPAFRRERIEKERAAVLSEAQMVNDLNYRLQMQMLGATHPENPIHTRFPIGLESQIASWTEAELRGFHGKWYAPENATLWVVGDVQEDEVVAEVQRVFGHVPRGRDSALPGHPWEVDTASLFRPPMPSRPVILHDYVASSQKSTHGASVPALRGWSSELRVSVATNDLVQGMQICWVAKSPLQAAKSVADLAPWLCTRLVVEAVRLRLQTRWCSGAVPCNFHAYDSHREGVSMATLTVMSEPARWQDTCQEALQEVLAIARYGVDADELRLMKRLVLDRVEEAARTQPWAFMGTLSGNDVAATSREIIEAMIASAPYGHLLTNVQAFSAALRDACGEVDLTRLNAAASQVLGHFGTSGAACGTLVVSAPAYIVEELSGRRVPFAPPSGDAVAEALRSTTELAEEEVRRKRVAIPAALLPDACPLAPADRHELPGGVVSMLLPNGLRVRLLVHAATPDGPTQSTMRLRAPGGCAADALAGSLGGTEAGLRVLESCGLGEWSREQIQLFKRMNSVSAEFRAAPAAAELDIHFSPSAGSRNAALEWLHWLLRSPQMDLQAFQEAQMRMKGTAHACEKSLEGKAMQLLKQQLYPYDQWLWDVPLEHINRLTLGQARKAVQKQFGSLTMLELDIACSATPVTSQANKARGLSHEEEHAGGSSSTDVGSPGFVALEAAAVDETAEDVRKQLEQEVCSILGGVPVPAGGAVPGSQLLRPVMARQGCELRLHVPDADERALVLVAGGAPGYWGHGDATWEAAMGHELSAWAESCASHPLHAVTAVGLMAECMNTRLLGRIRDQLSLTYSCEVGLTMFDAFPAGHFVCKLYAAPERLAAAAAAAVEVLRSPGQFPFTDREIEASKRVMAHREGSDQRERGYWINKLRPLPGGACAATRLTEERRVLEALSADDAQRAWDAIAVSLDDPFVVLATSGRPAVASLVPGGPLVARSPRPDLAPAAGVGGGAAAGLDLLD